MVYISFNLPWMYVTLIWLNEIQVNDLFALLTVHVKKIHWRMEFIFSRRFVQNITEGYINTTIIHGEFILYVHNT